MDKIIQICSQNDYQHISNFEWYVTVLVELSRMEGGTKHGQLIASQMMDVAIRVSSIRPFAVSQMALLVENHTLLLGGGTSRNSTGLEVLYAASWICGEFAEHLASPEKTLKSMFSSKMNLPGHITSIYLHNGMKLFSFIASKKLKEDELDEVKGIAKYLEEKIYLDFVASGDLEVQERATVTHQFLKYVGKHLEKGDDIAEDFEIFFSGELNPVAPKAQKKVPIPEGLDLDAWINEPPAEVEEESSEEEVEPSRNVFGLEQSYESSSPKKKNYVEPTEEEKEKNRQARIAQQNSDPFYLKDSSSAKSSPYRKVEEIPVEQIDLDVPLQIVPGLATTEQYWKGSKKEKKAKKSKKSKKHKQESEEEEDDGPSVLVSRNAEMPEGVELSDGDDDDANENDDDPHKALGAINLEDLEVRQEIKKEEKIVLFENGDKPKKKKKEEKKEKKEKKAKKEKKEKKKKIVEVVDENKNEDDLDFWLSPQTKEVPSETKPKKHKKSKTKEPSEKKVQNGIVSASSLALKKLAANNSLKLSYDVKKVPLDPEKLTAGISFANVGDQDISGIEMDFIDTANVKVVRDDAENGIKLDMDLQTGKVEDHLFLFKVNNASSKLFF